MLKFRTKAKTLEELSFHLKSADILPLYRFKIKDFINNEDNVLAHINKLNSQQFIIRSSSLNEDTSQYSMAGKFESILNVVNSKKEIKNAISIVMNSMSSENDEVFVQPMLQNVSLSGVIMSADIDTKSPYYIVNYEENGSTTGVTSGNSKEIKTFISFKTKYKHKNSKFDKLIEACQECEALFKNKYIDIEFAFTEEKLYILQVRPIVFKSKIEDISNELEIYLTMLHKKIKKLSSKHPKLLGEKTIFGVMPDWNPAEIIGIKPKPLALSLYKELITDNIWAYQRDNYGYRKLRSCPLLISFLGNPYIDVRVSFNSFIPKSLNEKTASKLVNYYLNKLSVNRKYHDKVEFQIVFSCYSFDIDKNLEVLKKYDFNEKELIEIKTSLLELTNNIINKENGLYKSDIKKILSLKKLYDDIMESELSTVDKIYWLVEDCKRYGTLPFAGIARAAFIAMQILSSMESEGIINSTEKNRILISFNTISKEQIIDKSQLSKDEFLRKYGHLRPGTYDILSKRYDEAYDEYFTDENIILNKEKPYEFSESQKNRIDYLLKKHGIESDFNELILFIEESIVGREYAKFLFTKHLSEVIRLIEKFGERVGISKGDLAFVDYQTIKHLYATLEVDSVDKIFGLEIEKNKHYYKLTQAIKLPALIINEDDIYNYELQDEEPNFITLSTVNGEIKELKNEDLEILSKKIVCIKSADPGYDYLFSKGISGLITCYGGANSHMAIRCAELNIPAVIGCGELAYKRYTQSKRIQIDAANRKVTIFQ